ncbi:MAG: competence/damage-inducible protein A [Hydrogenibacillus sp.]|nr:competence/damage-inducible protein A [Hydrogenibacillus sp.]
MSRAPRGEIIAVGTELLLGQTVNTNATWLSRRLAEIGVDVFFHTAVGDNIARLRAALEAAAGRSDVVVICGGLGPTEDDVTREALALHLGRPVVRDKGAEAAVRRYFERVGRPMAANNLRQAEVLLDSRAYPNDVGLAVGFRAEKDGVVYIALPGPPHELKTMFDRHVAPDLKRLLPQAAPLVHRYLHFAGIGESALAARLDDVIGAQSDPTIAVYAEPGHVLVRLTTRRADEKAAAEAFSSPMETIIGRLREYYFGEGEGLTLAEAVLKRLQARGWTLAVAESCTGGLVADALASVPGASSVFRLGVVPYQTPMKAAVLGLDAAGLSAHGAVSLWAAEAMARAVQAMSAAEVGLATTCVAGPGLQDDRPIGEAYIGLAVGTRSWATAMRFSGDRSSIRRHVAARALFELFRALEVPDEPMRARDESMTEEG